MHSHPVLLWTWRIAVALVGGLLLLFGTIMWFTPGPGWASVILGLAVLASEFGWARAVLSRARAYLQRLNTIARNRRQRSRKARKADQADQAENRTDDTG